MTLDMLYDRRTLKKVEKPARLSLRGHDMWYEAINGDLVYESKSGKSWGVVPAVQRKDHTSRP